MELLPLASMDGLSRMGMTHPFPIRANGDQTRFLEHGSASMEGCTLVRGSSEVSLLGQMSKRSIFSTVGNRGRCLHDGEVSPTRGKTPWRDPSSYLFLSTFFRKGIRFGFEPG